MADNNKAQAAAPPQIAEGEAYLFIRFNTKTTDFQVLFSNLFDALALHDMAETYLELEKKKALGAVQVQGPPITIPGVNMEQLMANLRKRGS